MRQKLGGCSRAPRGFGFIPSMYTNAMHCTLHILSPSLGIGICEQMCGTFCPDMRYKFCRQISALEFVSRHGFFQAFSNFGILWFFSKKMIFQIFFKKFFQNFLNFLNFFDFFLFFLKKCFKWDMREKTKTGARGFHKKRKIFLMVS